MRKRHIQVAVAAVAAPITLAFLLAGIRADAKPARLDHAPLEVPWLVTTPSATASAPAIATSARAKSAAPVARPAQPVEPAADAALLQCCAALHARGDSAHDDDVRAAYAAAARTCDAVAASPKARESIAGVRARLQGADVPLECR